MSKSKLEKFHPWCERYAKDGWELVGNDDIRHPSGARVWRTGPSPEDECPVPLEACVCGNTVPMDAPCPTNWNWTANGQSGHYTYLNAAYPVHSSLAAASRAMNP